MQFQCPCLTRMFVWNYLYIVGLWRSQGLDFAHAIEDVRDGLQMGQKWVSFRVLTLT